MTIDDFENYIRQSFSQRRLPVDRCSRILFSQLAHMPNYRGLNYPYQFVEREIMELEGQTLHSATKPAAPFNEKGHLAGFWHKHCFVPGYEHLGVNAKLALKLDDPTSGKASEMILRVAKPYKGRPFDAAAKLSFSRDLAQEFIFGQHGVQNRLSGKATGDWIVYLPHYENNYYLCIAKHDEDDFILDAIKACVIEFPFINDVLTAASTLSEPA